MVMTAAPKQVAVSAASNGMPATTIIDGLTAMMYAMARKVVRPPRTSCPTVLPRSLTLKNAAILSMLPLLNRGPPSADTCRGKHTSDWKHTKGWQPD